MLCYFHGDLVMGNKKELYPFGHFPDQLTESAYVCIIKGGINLVKQAEGGGVQFKYGKDKRDRRERLFTTGEQMY